VTVAVFVPAALLAVLLLALLLAAWWLFGHFLDAAAMSDRRVDRMRDAFSPRAKGAGGHLPAPARVREVVTGDQRELLQIIDSERNKA
jgi:hypothetical protein